MRKDKIVFKLFFFTTLSFLVLFLAQFIFQNIYLKTFYSKNKERLLANNLHILKQKIEEEFLQRDQINRELFLVAEESAGAIGIANVYGVPQYGFDNEINIASIDIAIEKQKRYRLYLNNIEEQEDILKVVKRGQEVQVVGHSIIGREEFIYPSYIEIEEKKYVTYTEIEGQEDLSYYFQLFDTQRGMHTLTPQNRNILAFLSPNGMNYLEEQGLVNRVSLEGEIIEIYRPKQNLYGVEYRRNRLLQEMNAFTKDMEKMVEVASAKTPFLYESLDSFVGIKNLVGVMPVWVEGELLFIFSMISLQHVEEVASIMKDYFMVIFVLTAGIIVLITSIYSKKVTKPLLHLNEVTKKIAALDFSYEYEVKGKDEIAELGRNINEMASRLGITLNQLKQDILLKEKVEAQRKQFIMDVSHELKTPLTIVKGICEGLVEGVYSEEKSYYEKILNEINQMSQMVTDLISVSRLEEEEVLQKEPFEFTEVLLKVQQQIKPLLKQKELKLSLDIEEVVVLGDEKKIETVIRNLYTNAIFYTPEQGTIHIETLVEKERVVFSIENTPAHIHEEHLDKIWQAFYRVDPSHNKVLGGSGLGLYLVKELLSKHGEVYGILNTAQGVKVWFSLPKYRE
jgi:signal transduction histidine kinase